MKYSIKELQKAKTLFRADSIEPSDIDNFLAFLETNPLKKRSLIPKGGNDKIMTPPELARKIVQYFKPQGFILEPCKGGGAFYDAILEQDHCKADWMEIDDGRDFLLDAPPRFCYDFVITNPPFSKLRAFLKKSMDLADNIVFLCPVNHLLGLKARKRDIKEAGFYVREICQVEKPKEWPSSGFEYAAILLTRYSGDCKFSCL